MTTNTCLSLVTYTVFEERLIEPFKTQRHEKADAMFNEGKTEFFPNAGNSSTQVGNVNIRFWVDHAAAQEYIDYITPLAESYGIEISTAIEDF
jgi:hypothetical protein